MTKRTPSGSNPSGSKEKNAGKEPTDTMLSCERCGIRFLWQSEAQQPGEKAPTLCPGCRHLLPSQDRERGVVKWFNARKQYGFIMRQEEADLFVHRSNIEGGNRLKEGDLVEFGVDKTPKGLTAVGVRVVVEAREMAALVQ